MILTYTLFTFIFIANISCYEYFIHYQSEDIPCIVLNEDSSWIRCLINQSNPLQFRRQTITTHLNIEFVFEMIANLTLPAKFFVDDRSLSNYQSIIFDTTQDDRLKQLNILTNTFVYTLYERIDFILFQCGFPILNIERNSFSLNLKNQIFVTSHNRTRTVLLKDYFSEECWVDEQSIFFNDYIIISTQLISNRKKQFHLTQLFINGLLFGAITFLTILSMYLLERIRFSS